ncbi:winged helix-turn-helix domain-containing protein [Jannaschia seohaensis]|uniref:Two-component system KDP operon response regulator KdpE n=1 Tax=Jannaschia seohaensis TaxID=475081 RepID=A0A2Y9AJ81_9RHOB|nr:winged helix-turn-helix domain-containing protein [Jannaschia seohaensis]PWJ20211.1 two-component system KDP operon response regulator KdpE [Jannaschia seohaensis]SSA44205.1 two-component system, OmpR family, KDP operon response regulator KdpE [Jannaschia seohaensis]
MIESGAQVFDSASLRVCLDGIEIELSKQDHDVLPLLLTNQGRVLSHERILNAVWRLNADRLTNVVDVYVGGLHRKLKTEGERIVIPRNVGYRMT